ncbi:MULTISPECIES: sensor domain-containing phosphodiesterase [Methylobacterium]|uniref:sensor domain-containing phosphodiesterase n=1 Tax=Methylobacterium TaxID=407 RepID=UPI0013EAC393|nr:EAL domain-containing protein [Methylobacterium sp. DB0501]NGM35997.1 EAL domain-containing protein [Methylobacterium sp. DB0501]
MHLRPEREAERLADLHALAILDTPPEEHFDAVCRLARGLFRVPYAWISLVDADRLWCKASSGIQFGPTARDAAFCHHAILTDAPLFVEDATADPRFREIALVAGVPAVRFYAGAPLVLRPGLPLGTLCLGDTVPRRLSPEELARFSDLAEIVVAQLRHYEARVASEAEVLRRRASEEALSRANGNLVLAEQMGRIGHWRVDLATGATTWSDEVCRIHGRAPGDPITDVAEALSYYHPEDRDRIAGLVTQAREHRTGFQFKARILRGDGEERIIVSRGICQVDEAGGAVALFGSVQDVTEMARAEAELQASAARLRASTALLDATLAHMDQGLMMVDEAGIVRVCNERALALLDLPRDLMRSEPSFDAVRRHQIAQDDFAGCDAGLRERVAHGPLTTHPRTYERERPNGTVLEIRTVPLPTGGAVRTYTDITARKAAEARASHVARHDPLTGLPNRALFRDSLDRRLASLGRHGGTCGLLCLDLDAFKAVNDTHGHLAGDALLREVAGRIRAVLRREDLPARLGGDEFAILLGGETDPAGGAATAERLVAALREPVDLGGQEAMIGVSIGIAFAPGHGLDSDTLLKRADLALYRAKSEGRNTYRHFAEAMDREAEERRRLELDLRLALQRGEFALHYQPVFDLAAGRIAAVEALLRWDHPARGPLAPAAFLPLAEETGLILPIGEWVLRSALRDARALPPGVRVVVNVAGAQLRQPGLPGAIRAALGASGAAAERLELDIAEAAVSEAAVGETAISEMEGRLAELASLGVGLAFDGFGAGASSLGALRRLPFGRIKLDHGLVASPDARDLLPAVVALGRALGMEVAAGGVETRAQLAALREAGCTGAQGFLLGRPVPFGEVLALLGGAGFGDAAGPAMRSCA